MYTLRWKSFLPQLKVFYPLFLLMHYHHKKENFDLIAKYSHYYRPSGKSKTKIEKMKSKIDNRKSRTENRKFLTKIWKFLNRKRKSRIENRTKILSQSVIRLLLPEGSKIDASVIHFKFKLVTFLNLYFSEKWYIWC